MTKFLCPSCLAFLDEDLPICPRCGGEIQSTWKALSRLDKLTWALGHPEAETRQRAAWLLGEERDPNAIEALEKVAATSDEPYLAREAVRALARIGPSARNVLSALRDHPALMVRSEARRVLALAAEVEDCR